MALHCHLILPASLPWHSPGPGTHLPLCLVGSHTTVRCLLSACRDCSPERTAVYAQMHCRMQQHSFMGEHACQRRPFSTVNACTRCILAMNYLIVSLRRLHAQLVPALGSTRADPDARQTMTSDSAQRVAALPAASKLPPPMTGSGCYNHALCPVRCLYHGMYTS
jgi:hypothetical protein